jgi:transcriptional regulator with XRE-family HTH domain
MRDLAARTHLSKTTLSRWESGSVVQTPSKSVLASLAQSLGASVEEVERAIVRGRSHQ